MHDHPSNHREKGCPLFLHGDDVGAIGIGMVWSKAVNCVSFGGMLGVQGTSIKTHLIIWVLFNNILGIAADGTTTMQVAWRHLVWSLYWLYRGVWPTLDPSGNAYVSGIEAERAGRPLAGGGFSVCSGVPEQTLIMPKAIGISPITLRIIRVFVVRRARVTRGLGLIVGSHRKATRG